MMGATDFQVVFKALAALQLSADELACLQGFLAAAIQPGHCFTLIEEAAGKRARPHYAGSRCHRCGQANGLHRYRCLCCGRSFNALTGTPLARLRLRTKWLPHGPARGGGKIDQLPVAPPFPCRATSGAVAKAVGYC